MPPEQARTARVEARIAPEALAIVKRAAEMRGRSVSDFVVAAAQEAAARTIEENANHSPPRRRPARLRRRRSRSAAADARPAPGSRGVSGTHQGVMVR